MENLVVTVICRCGRKLPDGNTDGYECPCGRSYWGHFTPWFQSSSNTEWIKTTVED